MIDPPSPALAAAAAADSAPQPSATAGTRGSARLNQAVRGVARSAMKQGEKVVQIRTTITLGTARRSPQTAAARTVQLLNPAQISVSRWSSRHQDGFLGAAFQDLKRSIQHDGKNQIPVLVRPLRPVGRTTPEPRYELAYGHRRLQACIELGLPVRAIVEELSEGDLVAKIHAENQAREPLSAFEAGCFYKQLLQAQLFASERKLAQTLGIDQAGINRKVWLASLPADFLQVFSNPLEISCDDIKRLRAAWNRDTEGIQHRSRALLEAEGPLPAKQVIAFLLTAIASCGDGGSITSTPGSSPLKREALRAVVEVLASDLDSVTLRVNAHLDAAHRIELTRQVERFLLALDQTTGHCQLSPGPAQPHPIGP